MRPTSQYITALLRHVISITNIYDVVRGVLTDPLKLVEHICNFVCDVLKLDEANQKKIWSKSQTVATPYNKNEECCQFPCSNVSSWDTKKTFTNRLLYLKLRARQAQFVFCPVACRHEVWGWVSGSVSSASLLIPQLTGSRGGDILCLMIFLCFWLCF